MAILTLSGEYGSGRVEVGKAAADALGYDYVDRATILDQLGVAGKEWEERGKEFDAHCPTVWERYDWSYMAFKTLMERIYLDYALKDRVVLMGRGGNFLLKDIPYALRIRLSAPVSARVERVMREEEMDRKTAEWLIEKMDYDSACYIHSLYGKRWEDPAEYDVLFDTSLRTTQEIVETLRPLMAEKERLDTAQARETLKVRDQAARVKAAVFSDRRFLIPTLEVQVDGNQIVVRGVIHNPEERARLEETVRRQAGAVPVKFEVHYR